MTDYTKTIMIVKAIYLLAWAIIQCGYIVAWTLTSIEFAGGPCCAEDALVPVMKPIQKELDEKLKETIGEDD